MKQCTDLQSFQLKNFLGFFLDSSFKFPILGWVLYMYVSHDDNSFEIGTIKYWS